jgi:hypothetical protein
MRLALLSCLVLVLACGSPVEPDGGAPLADASLPSPDGSVEVVDASVAVPDAGPPFDAGVPPGRFPLEAMPLTHDVDRSLPAVLESAALAGACDAVRRGATDRLTRLRCGKWMFFYETFGTVGVPSPLLDFNQKFYAAYFGRGFERMGFVADPSSDGGMPLGIAPTTGKVGSVSTRAFTCASCHFGRMSDGRYAVGYGNLALDYGRFIATIGAPLSLGFNANDTKVHADLRAELGPYVTQAKAQSSYSVEAGLVGLQLLGAGNGGQLTVAEQGQYLALETGTMDFLAKPAVDDGVWTVSRILSLWNLPDAAQRLRANMPHERLSWNGGTPTLERFLEGFVLYGAGTTEWTPDRLAPLAEYIRTLRTPPLETAPDAAVVREGGALFVSKGCLTCHDGPSGESAPMPFSAVGTDDEYANIYNAPPDAGPCCGLNGEPSWVTRQVRAPRFVGLAWQSRYLHNGAVESLEQLFCLTPRPVVTTVAQTAGGHLQTCEGLSVVEKQALIGWLRSL